MSDDTYQWSLEERLCNLQRRLVAADALLNAGILEDDTDAITAASYQLDHGLKQLAAFIDVMPADFANWRPDDVPAAVAGGPR